MKIFITGSLGFVGRHLALALLDDGHRITGIGHKSDPANNITHQHFTYLAADTSKRGPWQELAPEHDIVINLAGRSIFTLWNKKVKKQIYESRVLTTRNLAESLNGASKTLFFSTSAVGYYGDRNEAILTENEPAGKDFLASVCRDWEQAARQAESKDVTVLLTRFGIVLERSGGAMASMLPAFKLFAGGRLGSGRQWFPWIHLDDLIGAYRFVIKHHDLSGPVNWCAPHPVRNSELTEKLAKKLNRPALLPVPTIFIKTIMGEFGKALICSQRALPKKLLDAGYQFSYPDIDSALNKVVQH